MIHPDTELRLAGEGIGLGVFATRPIRRATIVWARDSLDRILPASRVAALPAAYEPLVVTYTHRDRAGDHVLCWDAARYVNHACDPNCLMLADRFDIALRDIAAGEQITCDYATLNIRDAEAFDCACGAADCRGRVRISDAARLAGRWRERARAALADLDRVPQPLMELVEPLVLAQAYAESAVPLPKALGLSFGA